jgi:hypothetical protein
MTNALGDWAVVNVQSSAYSTSESLRCAINLAVAPTPWLAWQPQSLGSLPKAGVRGSDAGVSPGQALDCAPGRNRTCDTRFRKPLLYPLSYEGDGP